MEPAQISIHNGVVFTIPYTPDPTSTKEYRGVEPPAGVHLPTATELLDICTLEDRHPVGLAYPPKAPVFWIKYGFAVYWNEVVAQAMAHRELQRLGSPVKVPAVFYAYQADSKTYIVMEYIEGRSGAQLLEATSDAAKREAVYRQVAFGIQELLRIPIPPQSRPAAVDGGVIQHLVFSDAEAPRHYQSADQIEQHFNLFLQLAKREPRIQGLSREPMVFNHIDIWPGNIIVDENGVITIIDFAGASILPSSFVKYSLSSSLKNPEYKLLPWVDVPSTEGVDNTKALFAASGPIVMGSASFARVGQRVPGYESV
ncbi:hypothetical protein FQN49_008018 [Arthroderma sp. PD_2]|nr:hypothetical protein FQN49_008018 [Arthroderma sp. PD_2]